MHRLIPARPQPGTVIALVALFVALGGTGYAAATISGSKIKNRSIAGKKVKRNTLGGTEIRESKLAKVPSARLADSAGLADKAKSADSATRANAAIAAVNANHAKSADSADRADSAGDADTLNGQSVQRFQFDVDDNGATQEVEIFGVTMSGNCPGGVGNLDFSNTSGLEAKFHVSGEADGTPAGGDDADFTAGDADGIDGSRGTATANVLFDDGTSATVLYGWDSDRFGGDATGCEFWGEVIYG
jgi:hypothetical protein